VPETINTKSLKETEGLLQRTGLKITRKTEWRFQYWKLFFVQAGKM
jgi:hypothetical protein